MIIRFGLIVRFGFTIRRPILGSIAACCLLGAVPPAQAVEASFAPATLEGGHVTSVSPLQASLSAYRNYARSQANGLVAMTKVLVREIKSGDLDAAQSVYAPAHRYLARLAPIARSFSDLHESMDADGQGFHRIEKSLFADRSTAGLTASADRLLADSLQLQTRIATLEVTPGLLLDAPAAYLEEVAARTTSGGTQRYARTDLWDLEANVDGTREIFALIEHQLRIRDAGLATRLSARFATMSERIGLQRDGCGFKTFDQVAAADKAALKDAMTALAGDLSKLRGTFAIELSLAEIQGRVAVP